MAGVECLEDVHNLAGNSGTSATNDVQESSESGQTKKKRNRRRHRKNRNEEEDGPAVLVEESESLSVPPSSGGIEGVLDKLLNMELDFVPELLSSKLASPKRNRNGKEKRIGDNCHTVPSNNSQMKGSKTPNMSKANGTGLKINSQGSSREKQGKAVQAEVPNSPVMSDKRKTSDQKRNRHRKIDSCDALTSHPQRQDVVNTNTSNSGQKSYAKSRSNQRNQHTTRRQSPSKLDEFKFEEHLHRDVVETMLVEQENVVKGFIRINPKNYKESFIHNPDGGKDIIIDGVKFRNRAMEGDEVVVMIFPESQWKTHQNSIQKTGKVIHILKQVHHRQAVGTLKVMREKFPRDALFSPRDSRVPRLRIPLKGCPKNLDQCCNDLFWARMTEWKDVNFARGQLIGDKIGVQGDIEAETRAILLENELESEPYNESLYQYFPKAPYYISEEDLKGREDLRKMCIFTIDPETAKDLDDAVSCEKLENGNFKIGVHISDVTHFLKEGTPLDEAVAERATTTYVVQRAYHMLPREMTMLCSLLPGEDKLAFSVFWEMTPDAQVISHYFTRSVINSCTQLAYEHAQVMIDEPEHEWMEGELPKIHNGWKVCDLQKVVQALQHLASIIRKRRFDSGALRVDQPKLSFRLGDDGLPASCATYVNKESHRLIEEFMLLANMTVATDLQRKFPRIAFLRCHDAPQQDMIDRLAETLEKVGVIIDGSSAGALQKSLQRYNTGNGAGEHARFLALSMLCSRPMARARYFCTGSVGSLEHMGHYALNVPLYTHFTSPIRRYADVMVHRLLSALLSYSEEPSWDLDYVNRVASNCNKMKFSAKKAGEQSSELFLALWVGQRGSVVEEAVVVDVKDHSFDALVCSTGTNVRVYTDKLPGSSQFVNGPVPKQKILWPISEGRSQFVEQTVTIFTMITVELRQSTNNLLKIEAVLKPPCGDKVM